MRKSLLTAAAVAFVAGAALAATELVVAAPRAESASAQLPDLGMAPLSSFQIDTTSVPGRKLLRYTAILVDVGAGPFVAIGTRASTSDATMSVVQRVYNSDGTYTDVPSSGAMFYAGDGHNHWHIRDIEGGTLTRLDNGNQVGALAKHGFCFSDNVRYRLSLAGAPQNSVYSGSAWNCGAFQPSLLTVTMGLSVGWGDAYPASTNLQWIDVTGLRNGHYRVTASADPGDVFRESTYSNNSTWANIKINGNSVKVEQVGPGA